MSNEEKRPSKAGRPKAPSKTRRWEDIPVQRRKDMKNKEVELVQLVKARDVIDGVVLLLV